MGYVNLVDFDKNWWLFAENKQGFLDILYLMLEIWNMSVYNKRKGDQC